jgi:hypothetical protein
MQRLMPHLSTVSDHRRPQGRLYDLNHLLLFCILALLSGATSYRKIQRFIEARREVLNAWCGLSWKRAPAHTSLRYALRGLKPAEVEAAFRRHAAALEGDRPMRACIALDGKTLRGSIDHFEDRQAAQVLSAFAPDSTLILGHLFITDQGANKSHEIPAAQQLIQELGLAERLFTLDALHAQKNSRTHYGNRQPRAGSTQT